MSTAPDIRVEESRYLEFFDSIINLPGVYESAADDACPPQGQLSMKPLMAAGNIFLKIYVGESVIGFFLLVRKGPGLYETHTLIRPEGRRWALRATRVGKAWMFCSTDAMVLSTFAWAHARNVRWLAASAGMREEATRRHANTVGGQQVGKVIYTLSLPEWVRTACQDYSAIGRKFHTTLAAMDFIPPLWDENRDGMAGLMLTMAMQGQPEKAQSVFNRWAQIHDFNQMFVVGRRGGALVLDVGAAVVAVTPDFQTLVLERRLK